MTHSFIYCIFLLFILCICAQYNVVEDFKETNIHIPKQIFQTHKSNDYILNNPQLKQARESWTKHKDFEYNFYNDEQQDEFMKVNYPDIYDTYKTLPVTVMKADLWRYCVIYKYGGIYTDADTICLSTPNDLIKNVYLVCAPEGDESLLCQWTFSAPKNSPILKSIIDLSVSRLQKELKQNKQKKNFVHYFTGPQVFTNGIDKWLVKNNISIPEKKLGYKYDYKSFEYPLYVYDVNHFHNNIIRHLFTGNHGWKQDVKQYINIKNQESFQNKTKITILIPSIYRERVNYVNDTLSYLFENKTDKTELDIYVHIGDYKQTSKDPKYNMSDYITSKYKNKITILETRLPEYGDLLSDENINKTNIHGVKINKKQHNYKYWMMKQNLDYYFAIKKITDKSDATHILFIEDDQRAIRNWDIIVSKGYKTFSNYSDLMYIKYSPHGMCAWLYNRMHMINYGNYLKNNYSKKPCDILIGAYLKEHNLNNTNGELYIFEHEGEKSSLTHKIQPLKTFGGHIKEPKIESFQNHTDKTNDEVPKRIFMCCKDKSDIPSKVMSNWKLLNPEYEITLYDDDECLAYIKNNSLYGNKYSDFYKKIPYGPIKADLWRLCVLYEFGGVYTDIDIEPYKSIDEIIDDREITFCTSISLKNDHIFQAFIYTTPKNEIIKQCLDMMMNKEHILNSNENTKKDKNYQNKKLYWELSGTYDMYNVLVYMLSLKSLESKVYNIQTQKIKLLKEYTPTGIGKDCKVQYNNKDLFASRYQDYDMYGHSFINE